MFVPAPIDDRGARGDDGGGPSAGEGAGDRPGGAEAAAPERTHRAAGRPAEMAVEADGQGVVGTEETAGHGDGARDEAWS